IDVPLTAQDAPANAEKTFTGISSVTDPEMCNMTICGIGYDDPGQKETDDEMLLVGWIPEDIVDPTACGKFYFGSNGFTDLATGKASLSDFLIGEAPSNVGGAGFTADQ